MDSCFLCVVGGTKLPSPGTRTASEGFGTCHECDVHACQIHGDKPHGQSFFRCADCMARLGIITAITSSPPAPTAGTSGVDPATHRILTEREDSFRALAPAVTYPAGRLVAEMNVEAMMSALGSLVLSIETPDLTAGLADQWLEVADVNSRQALGLPDEPVPEYLAEQRAAYDRALAADVVRVAVDTFQFEAAAWELRELQTLLSRTGLAAWALATAYAARGGESLSAGPWRLSGGLRMPPIVLMLGIAYYNRTN